MKKSKTTKRALLSSCIALMLCFSMLLGTTYAWFTDEVTSSNNIIKSGILDVEMYYGDSAGDINKNAAEGAIFDYQYWEPGYTQIKYVKIENVGNLAFRYKLNIIPNMVAAEGEVDLAKVIDVYMSEDALTRDAIANMEPVGTLADLMFDPNGAANGVMLPTDGSSNVTLNAADQAIAATGSATYCIALKMQEEAGNEYQNLSVGEGFKVQLLATQYTWENDSFDNMYDEGAEYDELPRANVKETGAKLIPTSTHGDIYANTTFQFLPTETYDEAQTSPYRFYHADFVVYADKDIPAKSVILPGYYKAYCDDYNDGKWIGLDSEDTITAGTKIRLVDTLGQLLGGTVYVNYEEICKWGNDNVGFLCGVSAVEENGMYLAAGTTITVELRLYETYTADEAYEKFGDHSTNYEKGDECYAVIGTYTYTIPAVEVDGQEELDDAIAAGVTDIELAAGEYKMPSSGTTGTVNISGTKDTVLDMTMGAYLEGATVAIEGVTIKTSTGYVNGNGADYAALYTPNVTYTNCTFEGPMRVGRDGAKFINCTFTELGNDYVWTYGNDVTFEGCTFNTDGKAILIYSDGGNEVAEVAVKDCVFTSTQGAKAGAIANQNCAAIEIHNYGNGVNLSTEGNTYDSNFSGEWRIKTYETGKTQIFVNGTEYTTIAIDGNIMTIDADRNVTVQ